MKKFLALALAMCMIFSMTTVSFATEGTSSDPHLFQYSGNAVSLTIPAGETVYYYFATTVAQQIEGATLEVSGDSVYDAAVIYGMSGAQYPMPNGKIMVTLSSQGTTFGIQNFNEESDITLNVNLALSAAGDSIDNPEVIQSINDMYSVTAELPETTNGASNAHYYKYVAEEDGQYVFKILGQMGNADVDLVIEHNSKQSSTYYDDVEEIKIDAKADDVIKIIASTVMDTTTYTSPAETFGWGCEFIPEGVEENPEKIENMTYAQFYPEISEFTSTTYFYQYIAEADGTLSFFKNIYSTSEGVVGDIYVTVNDTDEYQLSVDGEEDDYGDTILEIDVEAGDELIIKVAYDSKAITAAGTYIYAWTGSGEFVAGSEPNPIMHEELTETITLKPNEILWYTGRFAGSTLLIEEAPEGLSVIFNKINREAEDGIIEFGVSMPVGSYDAPKFGYVNDSTNEITFEVSFVYPEGTYQNPEEVELGDKEVNIPSNNGEYYLIYEVTEDGKVTVAIECEEGWSYYMQAMASTETHFSDGSENEDGTVVKSDSIEVNKGDLVKVILCGYDPEDPYAMNGTPEANFDITLSFESYVVTDDTIVSDSEITEIGKNSSIVIDEENQDEVEQLEDVIVEVTPTRKPQFDMVESLATNTFNNKVYQMLDLDIVDSYGYSMGYLLEYDYLEKVTVTLAIPESLKHADKITVSWLDEENEELVVVATDVAVNNGMITFDAMHFSTYVLSADPAPVVTPPVEPADPTDTADMAPVLAVVVLAAVAAVVVLKKKETVED